MKVQSDHIPESLVKSRGKTQVNYNIEEITIEDVDNEPRTAYEYDMVIVDGEVTRGKLIAAIIGVDYDIDTQIAIAFNELEESNAEHTAYQAERVKAKEIADIIMG